MPPACGTRLREMRADRVGGLGQEAERGAGDFGEQLRERVQLRGVGVLRRVVAEQDRGLLARHEARGDRLRRVRGLDAGKRRGNGLAGRLRRGDHDARERRRQLRRRARSPCARRASASRRRPNAASRPACPSSRPAAAVARPADGPCAGSCRRPARDRACRGRRPACPSHGTPARVARRRGNRSGAGGSRCCRCPSRARGARRAPAPPASRAATPARRAPAARACATTSVRPCATNSSAVCQSTVFHSPPCFTIGARQALVGIEALVGEAVLVREPALVDRLVLQRQHAHHAIALHLHDQVAAERIVRRHRLAARQLPRARRVAERLRRQRADRADVDRVAGELGIDRLADERDDLRVLAAADHAELHDAGDLLAEADAARALDAARHLLGRDQRAQVLVEHDALGLRCSATPSRRSPRPGPAAGIRRPGRRSGSRADG